MVTRIELSGELALVVGGVEVAEGDGDEAVGGIKGPEFEAGDADGAAGAAGTGVGAGQGPVVFDAAVGAGDEAVEGDGEVGESGHEGAGVGGDGVAAGGGGSVVDGEGSVGREMSGDLGGVLGAPSGGVADGEIVEVHGRKGLGSAGTIATATSPEIIRLFSHPQRILDCCTKGGECGEGRKRVQAGVLNRFFPEQIQGFRRGFGV